MDYYSSVAITKLRDKEAKDIVKLIKSIFADYWYPVEYWEQPFEGKYANLPKYGIFNQSNIMSLLADVSDSREESIEYRKILMIYTALDPYLCKLIFDPIIYYMFVMESDFAGDFYDNVVELALANLYNHEVRGLTLDSYATFKVRPSIDERQRSEILKDRLADKKIDPEDETMVDRERIDVETALQHESDIGKRWSVISVTNKGKRKDIVATEYASHGDFARYDESKDYHFMFMAGEREEIYYKNRILNECDNVDTFSYRSNDKIILYKIGTNKNFIYRSDLLRDNRDLVAYDSEGVYKGRCIRLDSLYLILSDTEELFKQPEFNFYKCDTEIAGTYKIKSEEHNVSSVSEYEATVSRLVIIDKKRIVPTNLTKNYIFGNIDISGYISNSMEDTFSGRLYSSEVPQISYNLQYDVVKYKLERDLKGMLSLNDMDSDMLIGGKRLTSAIFNSLVLPSDELRIFVRSMNKIDKIHSILEAKIPPGHKIQKEDFTDNRRVTIGNVAYKSCTFTVMKETKMGSRINIQKKLIVTVIVCDKLFTGISCERVYITKEALYFSPSFLSTALSGGMLLGSVELLDNPLDMLIEVEKYTAQGFTYIPDRKLFNTYNNVRKFLEDRNIGTPENPLSTNDILDSILGDSSMYECSLKVFNDKRENSMILFNKFINDNNNWNNPISSLWKSPYWLNEKEFDVNVAIRSLRIIDYKSLIEKLGQYVSKFPQMYSDKIIRQTILQSVRETSNDVKRKEYKHGGIDEVGNVDGGDTKMGLYNQYHKNDLVKAIYQRIVKECSPNDIKPDESWIETYISSWENGCIDTDVFDTGKFDQLFLTYNQFLIDTLQIDEYNIYCKQISMLFKDAYIFYTSIHEFIRNTLDGESIEDIDIENYEPGSDSKSDICYRRIINQYGWLDGLNIKYKTKDNSTVNDLKSYLISIVKDYYLKPDLVKGFRSFLKWMDTNPVHFPYISQHLKCLDKCFETNTRECNIYRVQIQKTRYVYCNRDLFFDIQTFWYHGMYNKIKDYMTVICNHIDNFYPAFRSDEKEYEYNDDAYKALKTQLNFSNFFETSHVKTMQLSLADMKTSSYQFHIDGDGGSNGGSTEYKISSSKFNVLFEKNDEAIFECPYYQSLFFEKGSFFILQNNGSLRNYCDISDKIHSCMLIHYKTAVLIVPFSKFIYLSNTDNYCSINGIYGITLSDRKLFVFVNNNRAYIAYINSDGTLENRKRLDNVQNILENAEENIFLYSEMCLISWLDETYVKYFESNIVPNLQSLTQTDEDDLEDVFCTNIDDEYVPPLLSVAIPPVFRTNIDDDYEPFVPPPLSVAISSALPIPPVHLPEEEPPEEPSRPPHTRGASSRRLF